MAGGASFRPVKCFPIRADYGTFGGIVVAHGFIVRDSGNFVSALPHALSNCAWFTLWPLRLALLRLALLRLANHRSALLRSAACRSAPLRLALLPD
jgi:hypothetical protein